MRPALPDSFLWRPLAHRALHDRAQGRPENSAAAVRAAVAAGYGIEVDVQISADGVAMVFHDGTLERMTAATGPVSGLTAAALQRVGLGDSKEPMPTLVQVLDLVGGRVPLLLELKDQSGVMGPTNGRLEQATAQALTGYFGPVAVMSYNPSMIGTMSRLVPQVPRGLTTDAFPRADFPDTAAAEAHRLRLAAIADYDDVGAAFISHDWEDLQNPRVSELKAAGAAVLCWTIKSAAQEAQAREIAQNITFEQYLPPIP